MHLIHHSRDPKHANKNIAQMFNFWDRLAGTLYYPPEREVLELGLWDDENAKFRSLADLYFQPFRGLWARAKAHRLVHAASPQDLVARD